MTKNLFEHYRVIEAMPGAKIHQTPTFDVNKDMIDQLAVETERWVRKALEKGPGWDVWRSNPRTKDGDHFIIIYDFALVPPGMTPPGSGLMFTQPELTPGERVRLLAGRHDWREDRWEDECGVPACGHPCCERARL